jgi:putative metal-binding protein
VALKCHYEPGVTNMLLPLLIAAAFPPRTAVCITPQGNAPPVEISVPADAATTLVSQGNASLPQPYYLDADGDGFGDANAMVTACFPPPQMVAKAGDCNDASASVHPGAPELCGNGIDEDCSGEDLLCSAEIAGWRITAGRVIPGATPGTVTGSYTAKNVLSADTQRYFGACFIADITHTACATDDDCTPLMTYTDGWSYCGSPDGSNEPRLCWIRPGGLPYCDKGVARPDGSYPMPTVPASTPDGILPRWMILSCLTDSGTTPAGCQLQQPDHHVYSWGPASTPLP